MFSERSRLLSRNGKQLRRKDSKINFGFSGLGVAENVGLQGDF